MPILYSVLIGINSYEGEVNDLRGCVYDASKMNEFLRVYALANDMKYDPVVLENGDAVRTEVIRSFQHLGKAGGEDLAVFYFSGHGSQALAPPELAHLEKNGKLQTILCHDSRGEKGQDLTDKEISQLIYEATVDGDGNSKGNHFLAIFDSCHSGSVNRNTDSLLVPKMEAQSERPIALASLYGHEKLGKDDKGRITTNVGPHVALSAAQSYEYAWEVSFSGIMRGAFTTALLESLNQTSLNGVSYGQLMARIKGRLHPQVVRMQTPLHDIPEEHPGDLAQLKYLFGKATNNTYNYFTYFNKNENAWKLDLGLIHQIQEGQIFKVNIADDPKEATVLKVSPGECTLSLGDWANPEVVYPLNITKLPMTKLQIGPSPNENEKNITKLNEFFKGSEYSEFLLWSTPEEAKYWISFEESKAFLYPKGSLRPCFEGVPISNDKLEVDLSVFFEMVVHVGTWEHRLHLTKKKSKILPETDLEIEWLHYPDYPEQDPGEPVNIIRTDGTPVLSYRVDGEEYIEPHFSLKIKKKNNRDSFVGSLWVAVLFFDEQYGIEALLPPTELTEDSEDEAECLYNTERGRKSIIPLTIPKILYKEWGEHEIQNYIKIYISTEKIDTSSLKMEPLELARRGTNRSTGREKSVGKEGKGVSDWTTIDLPFLIYRPPNGQPLQSGKSLAINTIQLTGPDGFSARSVRLTHDGPNSKSDRSDRPTPPCLPGLVEPASLNPGAKSDIIDNLIEISSPAGEENVTAETPLILDFGQPLHENEGYLPVGYDPETGLFLPLGHADPNGKICIQKLPDPEPVPKGAKGVVKSLKIYLQRLTYTEILDKEDPYPILAIANVNDNLDLSYERDPQKVREAVDKANRIVVVVHGIIGDTSDKGKILKKTKTSEGKEMDSLYDLALTFDYDSVSIPIEQTAADLKKKLEEAGIKQKRPNQKVVLVAHSMGGLVSRWMIEKIDGGADLIDHFVEIGSPNIGSPWASVYNIFSMGVGMAINFFPSPWYVNGILSFLKKSWKKVEVGANQLRPNSEIAKALGRNNLDNAPIPYTIIPGNVDKIIDERQKNFFKRSLINLQDWAMDMATDRLFPEEGNDNIVGITSMRAVPKGSEITDEVASDHFGYFMTESGLEMLGEVMERVGRG